MTAEEEEEIFEVEDILGQLVYEGKTLYQVRWKGYPPDKDTYEPYENLQCPEIYNRYLMRCGMKKEQNGVEKERKKEESPEMILKEGKKCNYNDDEFLQSPHSKKSGKKKTKSGELTKRKLINPKKENPVATKTKKETERSDFDLINFSSNDNLIAQQHLDLAPPTCGTSSVITEADHPPAKTKSKANIIAPTKIISTPAAPSNKATSSTKSRSKPKSKSKTTKTKTSKNNKQDINQKRKKQNDEIDYFDIQTGQMPINPAVDFWSKTKDESPLTIKVKQMEINKLQREHNKKGSMYWVNQTVENPFPIMKMEKLINENGILKIICQIPDENNEAIPLAFLKVIQPEMVNNFLIAEYKKRNCV